MSEDTQGSNNIVELATELTIAWLGNPNTRATKEDVPEFLKSMHDAVAGLAGAAPGESQADDAPTEYEPAVSVRKSLGSREHILSMIDGKPYKTLTRHLSTHGLTPDSYRARYGLRADYPMVAPAYSEHRRKLAKAIGLGRKPGETRAAKQAKAAAPTAAEKPKRRGRTPAPKAVSA